MGGDGWGKLCKDEEQGSKEAPAEKKLRRFLKKGRLEIASRRRFVAD